MNIAIRNATVVTVDEDRRIYENGAILVEDGRITWVGKDVDFPERPIEDLVLIDGKNKFVIPGLVNAHLHISHQMGRGCGDDLPFTKWLPTMFKVADAMTREDWLLSSQLSILEMIRSGTTTFADPSMYYNFDDVAGVVVESGIRAVLGKNITDSGPEELTGSSAWMARPFDREGLSLDAALAAYETWHGKADGRLQVRLSPQIWPACSESGYRAIASVMAQEGIGALVHHTEDVRWGEFVQAEFGRPPTMMLEEFGFLGPGTLLENAAVLSEEEMDLISASGTCLNVLPIANIKNGFGFFDVSRLRDQGVPLSIGTAGGMTSNVNDLFGEMKVFCLQQRALTGEADSLPAEAALESVTIDAARCLGLADEIGSLEVGKAADITIIDGVQAHLLPSFNPISTLVYGASGSDVETVIVNGEFLMREGAVQAFDEEMVLARVLDEARGPAVRSGASAQDNARSRWPLL